MKTNFINCKTSSLECSKDLAVIPVKGTILKYLKRAFYIEEISFDIEKEEYNIYMYEL